MTTPPPRRWARTTRAARWPTARSRPPAPCWPSTPTATGVVVVAGRPSYAESGEVAAAALRVLAEALPKATFLPALRRGNVFGALDMGLAPGLLPGRVSLDAGRQRFTAAWGSVPADAGLDAAGILASMAGETGQRRRRRRRHAGACPGAARRRPAERLPRPRRGEGGAVGRPLRRRRDRAPVAVGRRPRRRRPALRRSSTSGPAPRPTWRAGSAGSGPS